MEQFHFEISNAEFEISFPTRNLQPVTCTPHFGDLRLRFLNRLKVSKGF
jgi:hypothetical protein